MKQTKKYKFFRRAVYAINVLGTPVVVYAKAKGWIGDLELTLWGAEVAAAMAMAGLNVSGDEDSEFDGAAFDIEHGAEEDTEPDTPLPDL